VSNSFVQVKKLYEFCSAPVTHILQSASEYMESDDRTTIGRYDLWRAFIQFDEARLSKLLATRDFEQLMQIVGLPSADIKAVPGDKPTRTGRFPFDDAAKRILAYSWEAAERSGQSEITPRIFLHALLLEEQRTEESQIAPLFSSFSP
jgi:hypothetical protein